MVSGIYQASASKGVITDERLRRGGFWVNGYQHGRDAVRILLLHGRKSGFFIGSDVKSVVKV